MRMEEKPRITSIKTLPNTKLGAGANLTHKYVVGFLYLYSYDGRQYLPNVLVDESVSYKSSRRVHKITYVRSFLRKKNSISSSSLGFVIIFEKFVLYIEIHAGVKKYSSIV